ncbi:DMT family transporter [Oceanospirillum sanctuarii]|uniref:DMT family transporter n=1 Tax=Oceanospirillum sanctuarii TaxID=1434821 RepID=UPI000A374D96|nr:DMT family transporter [Oceanospirillum sanctuarii]
MMQSDKKGTLEMVTAMVLSGTIGFFVIESGQSFWNVVFFRCLIGALFLGGYIALNGQFRREQFDLKVLGLIIAGGITLVGNWVLLFASFDHIPFSIATIAYHLQPIMLVIAGALLARQLPGLHILFWLAVALGGLWLVVGLDSTQLTALFDGQSATESVMTGLLLALGSALLYTITTLLTKKVSDIPSGVIAFVQVLLGGAFLLPFVEFGDLPTELPAWGYLAFLGLINTGFMYVIMYDAFQRLSTSLIAILSFIYPVVALFVDYAAFDHAITLAQGVGVVLILLAVCAVKFDWKLRFKAQVLGAAS